MRNSRLDCLRFIGVALTLANHLTITGNSYFDRFLGFWHTGGWIGVDLFFVLSGFLVSGLIFKEVDKYQSFRPGYFLIRRGFKIYPAYYLFILVSFAFPIFFTKTHFRPNATAILHEAIFVSNYLSSYSGWLWSLCVEEHFYIFLSILFYVLVRRGKLRFKPLLIVYLLLLVIGFGFRLHNYLAYGGFSYSESHLRFDALFAGVLLYWVYDYRKDLIQKFLSSRLSLFLLIAGSLYLVTDFIFPREGHEWLSPVNLAVHPWIFGIIMINFLEYKNARVDRLIRPMAYVGMYSYSIYLFHGFVNGLLLSRFQGVLYYFLFFTLAIATGIVVSKTIEYPFLKLRDRWFPSRSKKLIETPATGLAGETTALPVPSIGGL